ncbi:hypothetical protein CYMTET_34707, partial [Cymbomonas tetramitiformis]
GYTDRLCSVCEDGYHAGSKQCRVCPNDMWLYISSPFFFTIFFFFASARLGRTLQTFNLSMDTIKIVAVIGSFNLNWPIGPEVFDYMASTNFNIDLSYYDCSLNWDYEAKWWFTMALPFLLIAVKSMDYAAILMVKGLLQVSPSMVNGWRSFWLAPLRFYRGCMFLYDWVLSYILIEPRPKFMHLGEVRRELICACT